MATKTEIDRAKQKALHDKLDKILAAVEKRNLAKEKAAKPKTKGVKK